MQLKKYESFQKLPIAAQVVVAFCFVCFCFDQKLYISLKCSFFDLRTNK